jgi:type I restriction enzyme, R subunit
LKETFPERTEAVPKTLIFAKDDSHAEDIVRIVREEFGKGNDFCQKITYKVTGAKPADLIQSFRNSYNPRIVVTVDLIATGTDIKPVEVVMFMRSVHSRVRTEVWGLQPQSGGGTGGTSESPFLPHKRQ